MGNPRRKRCISPDTWNYSTLPFIAVYFPRLFSDRLRIFLEGRIFVRKYRSCDGYQLGWVSAMVDITVMDISCGGYQLVRISVGMDISWDGYRL